MYASLGPPEAEQHRLEGSSGEKGLGLSVLGCFGAIEVKVPFTRKIARRTSPDPSPTQFRVATQRPTPRRYTKSYVGDLFSDFTKRPNPNTT